MVRYFQNIDLSHPVSRPFSVLSNAGIELSDRKIVVNARYCTNDRNIYAAGRNVVMVPKPNFQYTFTSPQEMAEKVHARVHFDVLLVVKKLE